MSKTKKSNLNFVLKIALFAVKDKLPELAHECPIGPVTINYENLNWGSKIFSMLPKGYYKVHLVCILKNKLKIFELIGSAEIS